jgi:hypothetical protein
MHTLPAKELVRELRSALSELRTHNSSAVIGPAGFSFPRGSPPRRTERRAGQRHALAAAS